MTDTWPNVPSVRTTLSVMLGDPSSTSTLQIQCIAKIISVFTVNSSEQSRGLPECFFSSPGFCPGSRASSFSATLQLQSLGIPRPLEHRKL